MKAFVALDTLCALAERPIPDSGVIVGVNLISSGLATIVVASAVRRAVR